eukprot:TRINITY_DN4541_c0_g1_i1.p1 TRINITY_DN4541_c0_g1~~TRINITY_DN4541_c0_g1_i1.p1  ORF type:complete len:358 (-),score=80.77 TRINITY_DN4541_c0_g1_i1:524-1597(-)
MLISKHLDDIVELTLERSRGAPTSFGQPLDDIMQEQQRDIPFLNVPILIRQACHHIITEGSSAYGLFERAKDEDKVTEMIDAFEVDGKIRLGFIEVLDVAILLMRFLESLPGPLLCDEGSDAVREALNDVDSLKGFIDGLPVYNRFTLQELFYMFSVVGRRKYASFDVSTLAPLVVGSYLSASLSATEMVSLATQLMLNFESIFNFDDTAPNGTQPRHVYLETGKSVVVGSCATVQDLKDVVLAKANDIGNPDNCCLYVVSGRAARKLDDVIDHNSIFFIPEIQMVPLEYSAVTISDIPMNLPPIEIPSGLPPIEMPTDLPPVDLPTTAAPADVQIVKREEDKDVLFDLFSLTVSLT